MKIANIDNSTWADISRSITWQYDNAVRLIGIMEVMTDFFNQSTAMLWNYMRLGVVNINNADDFGLAVWGRVMNCIRPMYRDLGIDYQLSPDLYKRILKMRFRIMNDRLNGNASVDSYCDHVNEAFRGNLIVTDGLDMSLSFTPKEGHDLSAEEIKVLNDFNDVVFVYPAGVKDNSFTNDPVFGFEYETEKGATDPTIANLNSSEYPTNGSAFAWRKF